MSRKLKILFSFALFMLHEFQKGKRKNQINFYKNLRFFRRRRESSANLRKRQILSLLTTVYTKQSVDRRFWVLPRPQNWFENLLRDRRLDFWWSEHLRVTRDTFFCIVETARPYMTTKDNKFRKCTRIETKVASALWRLATGASYREVSIVFGIGRSSVQLYAKKLVKLLFLTEVRGKYIRFPSKEQLPSVIQEFSKRTKLPNIAGAINGCHILIKAPSINKESYFNRKHRYSILLQGICGPNLEFFDVFTGVPESLHDGRMLKRSSFFR